VPLGPGRAARDDPDQCVLLSSLALSLPPPAHSADAQLCVAVTTILLVAGALSALTAAWWGALADRKGRKVVLCAGTVAELFEAGIMVMCVPSSCF